MSYRMTNRERSREPRGKGFWCFSCDANTVLSWSKCHVCGYRNPKRRFKKPTPSD